MHDAKVLKFPVSAPETDEVARALDQYRVIWEMSESPLRSALMRLWLQEYKQMLIELVRRELG